MQTFATKIFPTLLPLIKDIPTVLQSDQSWIKSLSFNNHHGTLIAALSDKAIHVWKIHAGVINKDEPTVLEGAFRLLRFNQQGTLLAATPLHSNDNKDGKIYIWNIEGEAINQPPTIVEGFEGGIRSLWFNPQGTMLAATADRDSAWHGKLYIWNIEDETINQSPTVLDTPNGTFHHSACFNPEGTMLAAAIHWKGELYVWDIENGKIKKEHPHVLTGFKENIISLAFNHDGTMLAASDRTTIRVWDIKNGKIENTLALLHIDGALIKSVKFNQEGTLLAAESQSDIFVWKIQNKKIEKNPTALMQGFVSYTMHFYEAMITATKNFDGKMYVWHLSHDAIDKDNPTLLKVDGTISSTCLNQAQTMMAIGSSEGTISVWNIAKYNLNQLHYLYDVSCAAKKENAHEYTQRLLQNDIVQTFDENLQTTIKEYLE